MISSQISGCHSNQLVLQTRTCFRYTMANLIANLPFSPLFACENRPFCSPVHKHAFSTIGGTQGQGRVAFIAKATSGSSKSSTSLSTVESDQSIWDKPEDLVALLGVGFAFVVAFWASLSVTAAIDKLPVLPGLFELIGILFSTWFVYRYLLFKPDRKELAEIIKKSLADIIGQ
ncbi:protein CURVATURE THYLAKOID 1C, chloroplastic [Helianthus annuus]|uniref:Cyanobacterial aminoacyl-tRNA synthetase CAAD domain-containing protein n=1 Tax=Helianthus annuus TaxID=4232 RepID=A0A251UUN7_HELAN|nr:protein CURVATURE THYLAKOID 1C, chloroplastic [Helianthus annuus]